MQGRYSKFTNYIYFIGDAALLVLSFVAGYYFRFRTLEGLFAEKYLPFVLFYVLIWLVIVSTLKLYNIQRITPVESIVRNLVRAIVIHVLSITALIVFIKAYDLSRQQLLFSYLIFIITVSIWRIGLYKFFKWYRRRGFNYRNVVVVGAGPVGQEVKTFFDSDLSYGYHFLGFFDDNPEKLKYKEIRDNVLGTVEAVKAFSVKHDVDEIYCALPATAGDKIRDLMAFCEKHLIRFKIIPDFKKHIPKKVVMDFYDRIPVLSIRPEPLSSYASRFKKRMFDFFFSLAVVLLIFPWLLPIIAIAIKLDSRGPIFFRQKRTGKRNKEFWCLKFRTMKVNNDADNKQASKDDSRITRVGRFLRKTNLDEIPQFINVLLDDMSVVGPRPHMLKHTEEYSKVIDKFMVRHFVDPGITGWAQVHGFRGETKDSRLMEKRVQYDVWYIENWSFYLDLRIVFLTVWSMIKGDKNAF